MARMKMTFTNLAISKAKTLLMAAQAAYSKPENQRVREKREREIDEAEKGVEKLLFALNGGGLVALLALVGKQNINAAALAPSGTMLLWGLVLVSSAMFVKVVHLWAIWLRVQRTSAFLRMVYLAFLLISMFLFLLAASSALELLA